MKMSEREKAFRQRAAGYGLQVKKRGKVFTLSGPDAGYSTTTMAAHELMFDLRVEARRRDFNHLFAELIGIDLFKEQK